MGDRIWSGEITPTSSPRRTTAKNKNTNTNTSPSPSSLTKDRMTMATAATSRQQQQQWRFSFRSISLLLAIVVGIISWAIHHGQGPDSSHIPEFLRPYRPPIIALINGIGSIFTTHGILKLSSTDQLLHSGCKAAKLPTNIDCILDHMDDTSDYNPILWRKGLSVLKHSLETEANLTPLGVIIVNEILKRFVTNRARLIHQWKLLGGTSVLEQQVIKEPIIILGLPRTGSTFLHNLLSQDPDLRAPLHWEYIEPVPVVVPTTKPTTTTTKVVQQQQQEEKQSDDEQHTTHPTTTTNNNHQTTTTTNFNWEPHIANSQANLDMFYKLTPGMYSMHPIDADMGEECIVVLGAEYTSVMFQAALQIPSYWSWLAALPSHRHALRWQHRTLQYLQLRAATTTATTQQQQEKEAASTSSSSSHHPKQWVLKAPWFMWMLDEIVSEYSDAKIVWTHRAPSSTIASLASLYTKNLGAFSDDLNLTRIGYNELEIGEEWLYRGMKFRDEWHHNDPTSHDRILDIHLDDLKRNPIEIIEQQLYPNLLGRKLSTIAKQNMIDFLNKRQFRHGHHKANLTDFGLTRDLVMAQPIFQEYCTRYNVSNC